MEKHHEQDEPGIVAIVIGIAAVAFCCFAPLILAALGAAGMAAFFRQYLALFLLASGIVVVLGVLSYKPWKSGGRSS